MATSAWGEALVFECKEISSWDKIDNDSLRLQENPRTLLLDQEKGIMKTDTLSSGKDHILVTNDGDTFYAVTMIEGLYMSELTLNRLTGSLRWETPAVLVLHNCKKKEALF